MSFEENRNRPANMNSRVSQEQSSILEFVKVEPRQKEPSQGRYQGVTERVLRDSARGDFHSKNPIQTLTPAFKSYNDLRYLDPQSRNICAEIEQSTLVASPIKHLSKAVTHKNIGALELADSLAYANLTQAISSLQLDHMRLKTELKFF